MMNFSRYIYFKINLIILDTLKYIINVDHSDIYLLSPLQYSHLTIATLCGETNLIILRANLNKLLSGFVNTPNNYYFFFFCNKATKHYPIDKQNQ